MYTWIIRHIISALEVATEPADTAPVPTSHHTEPPIFLSTILVVTYSASKNTDQTAILDIHPPFLVLYV